MTSTSRLDKREKALATFIGWFRDNYPGPDTVIHKPDWHAPKVFRAVEYALKDAGLTPSETATKTTWQAEAYAKLGGIRNSLTAEHVAIIQAFIGDIPNVQR